MGNAGTRAHHEGTTLPLYERIVGGAKSTLDPVPASAAPQRRPLPVPHRAVQMYATWAHRRRLRGFAAVAIELARGLTLVPFRGTRDIA